MSALMKELLIDYADGKVDKEMAFDIEQALDHLPTIRKQLLLLYSYGYSSEELAQAIAHPKLTKQVIDLMLAYSVEKIAVILRISDKTLITYAKRNGYAKSKIPEFEVYLTQHSKQFT